MIAEPWDVGPGGYQLGNFPAAWLEWNDRYRDRVRRFWRGDAHMLGDLATALAGSSDVFAPARHPQRQLHRRPRRLHPRRPRRLPPQAQRRPTASTTATATTRTSPGTTASRARPTIPPSSPRAAATCAPCSPRSSPRAARIMLTAGDEFGRTPGRQQQRLRPGQRRSPGSTGTGRDRDLEAFAAALAALRRAHPALADPTLLTGAPGPDGIPDVAWLTPAGHPKTAADWQAARGPALAMVLGARRRRPPRRPLQPQRARGRLPPARPRRPPWPRRRRGPPHRRPARVAFVAEAPGGAPRPRSRSRHAP